MARTRAPFTTNQVGMGIALVSIAVFFAALMLVFWVRLQAAPPAPPVDIPAWLWFSSAALIASSLSLEASRRALRRADLGHYRSRLSAATFLGVLFLALQVVSWERLLRVGIFAAANPRGSMFYIFIGLHAAHLLLGLAILAHLLNRSRGLTVDHETPLRRHRMSLGVAAWYWHFMGALWISLFALLVGMNKSG